MSQVSDVAQVDGGWQATSGSRRCQERRRKSVAAQRNACNQGVVGAEVFSMSVCLNKSWEFVNPYGTVVSSHRSQTMSYDV